MALKLVREESPMEFFKEQLERAMEHQKVSTSAFTEHYLVSLLAGCVRGGALPAPDPGYDETPLALMYVQALRASRHDRVRLLRAMGDTALFVSGFFAESLPGGPADVRYYASLGGRAYAHLGREHEREDPSGTSVFVELSGRFRQFVDVLSEVSEKTRLTTPLSVVRLYERWLATRSARAAALLAEQGITPGVPNGDTRH
jgi:hypothetical protein